MYVTTNSIKCIISYSLIGCEFGRRCVSSALGYTVVSVNDAARARFERPLLSCFICMFRNFPGARAALDQGTTNSVHDSRMESALDSCQFQQIGKIERLIVPKHFIDQTIKANVGGVFVVSAFTCKNFRS